MLTWRAGTADHAANVEGGSARHGRRPAHRRADAEDAAAEILCRALAAVDDAGEAESAAAGASRIHDRAGKARRLVRVRTAKRRRRTAERRRLDDPASRERRGSARAGG